MRRTSPWLVFGLPAIVCAAWALRAGKDLNWDLLNYHYYLPFQLLAGRIEQENAPILDEDVALVDQQRAPVRRKRIRKNLVEPVRTQIHPSRLAGGNRNDAEAATGGLFAR